jgi:hypothetical protein
MARLRKKDRKADAAEQAAELEAAATPSGPRAAGPWDASEKSVDDDPAYLDLGALKVRGRVGFTFQLPADGESGNIGSVVLVTEEAGLELRAFAATRSGGLWDEVRADLVAEVTRLEGECEEVEGPFGPELRVKVPTTLPDGSSAFQPSRIIGIEGPRWMLRATFLGAAALEPSDEGLLMDALRDVVVVRGDGPRIPREPLLLTVPDNAVVAPPAE